MQNYNKFLNRLFSFITLLLLCPIATEAAREGKAQLIIHHVNPRADGTSPKAGDMLNLAFKIDAQNETITGVVIYLTLDDAYFEIIPARLQSPFLLQPFRKGTWLDGTVALNSTLGDSLTDSMANRQAGFQLVYNEDVPPKGFGETSRGTSGKGVLAELRLRLLKDHPNPLQAITVDHNSPTGSESGYFNERFPGIVYSLKVQHSTTLTSDFNDDGLSDFNDFLLFVQNYGRVFSDNQFSGCYDLDGDSEIGFGDFLIFTTHYGQ